jgi:hypothetical protein
MAVTQVWIASMLWLGAYLTIDVCVEITLGRSPAADISNNVLSLAEAG